MFGLSFGTIKWIAIGIVIAAVSVYIGFLKIEVGHYKNKAGEYEQKYTSLVKEQATKLTQIEAQRKLQDQERQTELIKAAEVIKNLKNRNLAEIKKYAQELDSCKLSTLAIGLFNNPNGTSRPEEKDTTGNSNTPDASRTSGVEEPVTITDLLEANEENKANFEDMRLTIKAWQKLWRETETNLNGTP